MKAGPVRERPGRWLLLALPIVAAAWTLAIVGSDPPRVRRHLRPGTAGLTGPTVADCPAFPADSVWNTRVDRLPVDGRSADYIATIDPDAGLHPDFGSGTWDGGPIGIPFALVPGTQPLVPVSFQYAGESDPGP